MANVAGSRLFDMKTRFQQRRIVEKEQKLVEKYEANQAKVLERLGTKPAPPGKVRQMFEDARRTKAGIDKSYPLQPLNGAPNARPLPRSNGSGHKTVVHNVTQEIKQYSEFNGDISTFRSQKSIKSIKDINLNEDTVDNIAQSHSLDLDLMSSDAVANKLPNVGGSFPSQRPIKRETNNNVANSIKPRVASDQKLNGNNAIKAKKPTQVLPKTPQIKANSTRSTKTSPTVPLPKSSPEPSQNLDITPPITPKLDKLPVTPIIKPKTPMSKPATSRPATMASKRETVVLSNSANGPSCRYCQRNFASDRIEKHETICSKTLNKKRKQYDAVKHRVTGTDVEVYVKKARKPTQKTPQARVKTPPTNQSNWRKKHEEFINTIRAAKQAQAYVKSGGKLSDLPPPPPSENLDYISCPHCNRRFNQSAAERHIPKCANFQFNKPKPAARKR